MLRIDRQGSLPFRHFTLKGRKPLPKAYPAQLETLGDHLGNRRLDLGLLQREIAEKPAIHKMTGNDWKKNRDSPLLRFVPRIVAFPEYVSHPTTPRSLAERILRAQRLLGLSQKELACRLAIDPTTLSRQEREERKPSRKLTQRLSAFLGRRRASTMN